jgi:hypothetical protein
MSGPKTSHISIEEQIRMQLAAADKSISAALSNVLMQVQTTSDQISVLIQQLDALGETDQACAFSEMLRKQTNAVALQVRALKLEAKALNSLSSVTEISEGASRITAQANKLKDEALPTLQALLETTQDQIRRSQRSQEASSFAASLKAALKVACAAREGVAQEAQAEREALLNEAAHNSENANLNWEDVASVAEGVVARYSILMASPQHLTAAASHVLIKHGSALLDALQRCNENQSQTNLLVARNLANMLADILPGYETQARALREICAKLSCFDVNLDQHVFKSVDEAEALLNQVQASKQDARNQDYIRSCIDKVMQKHGYSIARSVSLERASAGEHAVFGSSEANSGVHVFVGNAGDMMMEAVGVSNIEAVPECSTVSFSTTENPVQAQNLLQLQQDFCSVYAEIESDLAEYGISMESVHRLAPDINFSKEMHVCGQVQEEKTATSTKTTARKTQTRKRRQSAAQNERAL